MDEETENKQVVEETEPASEVGEIEAGVSARKSKKALAGIIVAAVVVIAAVGGGIALAIQPKAEVPVAGTEQLRKEAPSQAAQKVDQKSELVVTVKADGIDEGATKAKIVVKDKDDKDAVGEREVASNEPVKLGELAKGDYSLYVTVAPICEDGSTYRLPDSATTIKIEGEGKAVELEVALAKLAKEDMSKEQLEASATILASAGKTEAATQAQKAAQSAPSVTGSADAVAKPAPGTGGNSGNASGSGSSSGGSSNPSTPSTGGSESGNTTPAPQPTPPADPNEGKTRVWVADYETRPKYEQKWVSKWEQVPDYSNPSYVYYCSDCGIDFSSDGDFLSHNPSHHTGSRPVYPMVSVDNGGMESVYVGDEQVEVGGRWEWR